MFKKKNKEVNVDRPPLPKFPMSKEDIAKEMERLQKQMEEETKREEAQYVKPEVKIKGEPTEPNPNNEIRAYIDNNYGNNLLYGLLTEQLITNELLRQLINQE